MSLSVAAPAEMLNAEVFQMENDLPSLACQAAIELDDLILDRFLGCDCTNRLIGALTASIPETADPASPNWLLDPTTVVFMNKAIGDARDGEPPSTMAQFLKEAGGIAQKLNDLVAHPHRFRDTRLDELKEMRSFCVALSRHASSSSPAPDDVSPDCPFRG